MLTTLCIDERARRVHDFAHLLEPFSDWGGDPRREKNFSLCENFRAWLRKAINTLFQMASCQQLSSVHRLRHTSSDWTLACRWSVVAPVQSTYWEKFYCGRIYIVAQLITVQCHEQQKRLLRVWFLLVDVVCLKAGTVWLTGTASLVPESWFRFLKGCIWNSFQQAKRQQRKPSSEVENWASTAELQTTLVMRTRLACRSARVEACVHGVLSLWEMNQVSHPQSWGSEVCCELQNRGNLCGAVFTFLRRILCNYTVPSLAKFFAEMEEGITQEDVALMYSFLWVLCSR